MYHNNTHIHLVGIGGIGMSGIALLLRNLGYIVSGCDLDLEQQSIKNLINAGATIYAGNNTSGCNDHSIDIIVHTTAVSLNNPELVAAAKRGIPIVHRSIMLAELMRRKFSIAISGAHGKTTTTSLIAHLLTYAQMDPTYVIGGHLTAQGSNAHLGSGKFFVAEADESDRSLLNLPITLAVITNIDLEHLETYHDINDIRATFEQFLTKIPFYGKAFLCIDDPHVATIKIPTYCSTITYGFSPAAQVRADTIMLYATHSLFKVYSCGQSLGNIMLSIPGEHNVLNALAAIAVGLELQIPFTTIASALEIFSGIERRFSFRGTFNGADVFDDYGHHPREIEYTLRVARNRSRGKITVIFQPHRYSRTSALWNDFVSLFAKEKIDHLVITDIYAASESPLQGVTSQQLVAAIKQAQPGCHVSYIPYDKKFEALKNQLVSCVHPNDLVLLLGAGSIYRLAHLLT